MSKLTSTVLTCHRVRSLEGDGRALCSMKLTGSRMPRAAPLKLHSICGGRGGGAFQAPPCKTVLEKCTRWSDFYVSVHMLSTGAAGRDVRVNAFSWPHLAKIVGTAKLSTVASSQLKYPLQSVSLVLSGKARRQWRLCDCRSFKSWCWGAEKTPPWICQVCPSKSRKLHWASGRAERIFASGIRTGRSSKILLPRAPWCRISPMCFLSSCESARQQITHSWRNLGCPPGVLVAKVKWMRWKKTWRSWRAAVMHAMKVATLNYFLEKRLRVQKFSVHTVRMRKSSHSKGPQLFRVFKKQADTFTSQARLKPSLKRSKSNFQCLQIRIRSHTNFWSSHHSHTFWSFAAISLSKQVSAMQPLLAGLAWRFGNISFKDFVLKQTFVFCWFLCK